MGKMKLRALDPLLHPQDEDMLYKKSAFVERFYRLITASVEPPFAISIDGLWGTGKTTVMQMLQNKLRIRDGGYPVFWFNPWEYQEAESIVLAFLQRFADETTGIIDKTVRESLKILGTVGFLGLDVALSALPGKLLAFSLEKIKDLKKIKETGEMVEEELQKEYEKYKDIIKVIRDDFRKLINTVSEKNNGKPVIIFFDDLDRCLPDKAIQLLEAVKNLFVIPKTNVIFVCGIDTGIAKQFIKSHYKGIEKTFAINYFRKIFNLTISMPYSSEIETLLSDYIKKLYDWHDPDEQKAEAKAETLANMVFSLGVQAEITSVRKYLNVIHNFYTFRKFNTDYEFDPSSDFVVHLLIVKEAWQPLYEKMRDEALKAGGPNMENVVNTLKAQHVLSPTQEQFLSVYFGENTPFGQKCLSTELSNYPTLA